MARTILFICIYLFFASSLLAANRTVNLVVNYKTVCFTGCPTRAIAVNNSVPGPTLHFKMGDQVTINVCNQLNEPITIHWHGILDPWQMDGVHGVSQRGIPPGCVFSYKFTLYQAGTYWYHSHTGLQEQQGLYGAFIIDPPKSPAYHYTKDYVIVLSDWSNTDPNQIMANLKKDGDYYSPRFPLQPSLQKFIHDYLKASTNERCKLINDYKTMQKMRMSLYDLSDVAYDAFLLNGHSNLYPWTAPIKVGDVVRLRFIGASSSSIFRVKIPCATMQMVHVQGNDVKPHPISDFTIAPGETYDVLVKIEKNQPYIIYAESRDTVGAAYGALVTSPHQGINYNWVMPFPEPLPVTQEMMSSMMSMHHSTNMKMNHSMSMQTEPTIIGDAILPFTSSHTMSSETNYQNIKAAVKTNDPNRPIAGVIKMELFGYMDRFIWFINGMPEYKACPIKLEPDKRYRIIFTNSSMMHHPMHIHGHWFILRNGNDAYDPLLHTIDVPPGATITTDIDTDASGQWFFHCHLIYHMSAGMARVFQYSSIIDIAECKEKPQHILKQTSYVNRPIVRVDEVMPIDLGLIKHPAGHDEQIWVATFLDMGADPFNNAQRITYKGLYGYDYDKLELFMNDAETKKRSVENADLDVFYWHLLSQFWALKGGINYFYRPAVTPYWQPGIGIEGLMPYFIDTSVRGYYHKGSTKLDIELTRATQITNNFFIQLEIRSIIASKTIAQAGIGRGLNIMYYTISPYYRLMPGLNLVAEFEHEQDYGAFKNIQKNAGSDTIENTLTFGISVLF